MTSILNSIKKMIGIQEDYQHFDADIIMHINSVLMILTQLGVGPDAGFVITGADEQWSDYITDSKNLEAVKSYIYLKVRLLFDPPTSSTIVDSFNRQINELEWRLNVQAESK